MKRTTKIIENLKDSYQQIAVDAVVPLGISLAFINAPLDRKDFDNGDLNFLQITFLMTKIFGWLSLPCTIVATAVMLLISVLEIAGISCGALLALPIAMLKDVLEPQLANNIGKLSSSLNETNTLVNDTTKKILKKILDKDPIKALNEPLVDEIANLTRETTESNYIANFKPFFRVSNNNSIDEHSEKNLLFCSTRMELPV